MIYNEKMETLERSQMEELQLKRLQETVNQAYHRVKFYQTKLDELGVKPEDIQSLEDVKKLPFTVKKDLRDHYPFGLLAVPMEKVIRLHASSGTSGKPTVVAYTRNDIYNWSEIIARSIVAAGGKQQDTLHNAYGYGLFTGGLGVHHGAEALGITTVPVSGGNTKRQILLIQDFKPQVICSTPSYALLIAEQMEKEGLNPRNTSLKYGIFGAEPWSEEMRQKLEEKFDIKAMDIYGLSEVVGPGVSIECHEKQDGLHIQEDHFFVEVIDPDTLEPVPDGEFGELVFTSLTKEALPIIRYRTGDIAYINKEKCKCGRTTTRMSRVKGRIDDMMVVRGVNVFPSEMERTLLGIEGIAPHYQIHLKKNGPLDAVEVHVEVCKEVYEKCDTNINHPDVEAIKKSIQLAIKQECLVSTEVKVQPPNTIPRSNGKAIRVVDQSKKQALNV